MKEIFYDLNYIDGNKEVKSFSLYKNKVIVLFNFAIHSSFTDEYFKKMELLNKLNSNSSLKIISFPNSSFFKQNEENLEKTKKYLIDNYQISFDIASKIEDEPLNNLLFYKLSLIKKFKGFNLFHPLSNTISNYWISKDPLYDKKEGIKWVYTTFIISKDGRVKRRFECVDDFTSIVKEINKEINK